MPDTGYLISVVAVSAAITWTLRALPFAVLAPLRHSALIPYIGRSIPIGVMAVLVVYTLRHTEPGDPARVVPAAAAVVVTAALHLWRRNLVLSMFVGTAVNIVLASTIFA